MNNKKNVELDVSKQALMSNCSIVNIEGIVSNKVDNNVDNPTKEELKIMKDKVIEKEK